MKVVYAPKKDIRIEFETSNVKELFENMASLQEVLAQPTCEKCGSEWIFQVRNVADGKKTYTYYELKCTSHTCGASLAFGSHSEGDTLFPKRYEEVNGEKKFLPDKGWMKWDSVNKVRI
tara:strand:+ start:808 stop:1164 length:357 start_codon:yes stop_codon:yes gene_type:complete